MKKVVLILVWTIFTFTLIAQVPQGFAFQGVAFDDTGAALNEREITVRVEIIDDNINGTSIYSELHDIITSSQGLYSLNVGMGITENGQFNDIMWIESDKFIKVSIALEGEDDYEVVGTNQFLSVPYALAAGSAPVQTNIYAKESSINPDIIVVNGDQTNGYGSIKYSYQWLDGNPQDVLVEAVGLPSNLALYTDVRDGFQLPSRIKNTSLVDTIIDGVQIPSTVLGIDDTNVMVTPGEYAFQLEFKIGDKVMQTLDYNLKVYGATYDECFDGLPAIYSRVSNTCSDLNDFYTDQLTISELSSKKVSLSSIFVSGNEPSTIEYPLHGDNCNIFYLDLKYPDVLSNFEILYVSMDVIDDGFQYTAELFDTNNGDDVSCTIVYKK